MKHIRTEFRGREVTGSAAERLRFEARLGMEATRILASGSRVSRPIDAPDRQSVRLAMNALEARIVDALWTLARLPNLRGPEGSKRHGVEYIQEQAERWANAVENGWTVPAPRPALPSARQIDAMHEPLEWLTTRYLAIETCRLVTAAAATKRGDVKRRVSWPRVRDALPEMSLVTVRSMQRRYDDGLRELVAVLSSRGRG